MARTKLSERTLAVLKEVGCNSTTYDEANDWLACYGLGVYTLWVNTGIWGRPSSDYEYGFYIPGGGRESRRIPSHDKAGKSTCAVAEDRAICMAAEYLKQHPELEYHAPKEVSVDDIIEYRKYHGNSSAYYKEAGTTTNVGFNWV